MAARATAACVKATEEDDAAVVLVSPAVSRELVRCTSVQQRTVTVGMPGWDEPLHPRLDLTPGEVVWFARAEMARTVGSVGVRNRATMAGNIQIPPAAAYLYYNPDVGATGGAGQVEVVEP